MEVIFINIEIVQICDITLAVKFALKTKTKIEYFPFKYEKGIEFLFSKNKFDSLFYTKISNVFGGMGSWNDSPPYYAHEKGLESEYDSLTEELLTQIRLALLYSVNEW